MLHFAAPRLGRPLAWDGAAGIGSRTMDNQTNLAERIALELLRHDGAAVIWQAQVTAATAYREGRAKAAEILLKIADAAEEILRQDVAREISWHRLR
jgi:hypothetical protein